MSEVSSTYQSLRIGGLESGLDTDEIVEQLLLAEETKIFRIEQEEQVAEWEQEAYRNVITEINDFIDSNYNSSDNSNNILSTSGYKSVETSSSVVSMIANSDAVNGSYTIDAIDQLATAATVSSSGECKGKIVGSVDLRNGVALNGLSFDVRLDGVQQTISFSQDYEENEEDDILTAIQTQLDDEFGSGRISASINDAGQLEITANNSVVQVLSTTSNSNGITALGLTSGDQNTVNLSGSLSTVFGETEAVEFTINEISFSFEITDSIQSVITAINKSDAGVTMTYNTIDDSFTLTTKETGAGSSITIENTSGNFFGEDDATSYTNIYTDATGNLDVGNGQDAIFYLNNSDKNDPIYRSTNTFTIDGVTTTLKAVSTEAITYTVQDDMSDAKDKIVAFVDEYNDLLDMLHGLINETKDYDYSPLSDEQKDEMSDSEIEKWEEAAKQGLLSGDSTLYTIYNKLRSAFISPINGTTLSFADIGIDTVDYESNGKITIDEDALDAALEANGQEVINLFSQASDIKYSRDLTSTEASDRFDEVGFAQRINDILKNAVTTSRNESGFKGTLLEKAGIEGDTTEFTNSLSKELEDIRERLDEAEEAKDDKEDYYWDKFTTLETYISRMNTQSEWLTSQFG
jgi:flagellar hook-associated protein 2